MLNSEEYEHCEILNLKAQHYRKHNYLAQVTSNIWGTKFKIVGLAAFLPANLGAVIYKTSLLHLQPRQMTIYLPEVRKISMDYINLPVFSANVFSEDEDDLPGIH
ncbi:tubby-related 4-like [Pelobates cultripes]|uniref:Tubby-related 4-like, partial n=1 Tax=Pelobates cultripes TaxID=61616 RepID=A0AAD1RAV7_PELCU|nr:tubby-related 4-like [Pelobates cultripes]